MPSIIAHCLTGDSAVLKCGNDYMHKIVNQYHAVFRLGCQGPDPFFFYHIIPIKSQKNAKEIRWYGSLIHREKVNEFFKNLLEGAKSKVQKAYAAGFLTHHALDCTAHPYVYWHTDSLDKDMGYKHALMESEMDLGLLECLGIKIKDYRPDRLIKVKKEEIKEIAQLMQGAIKKTYNKFIELTDCKDIYNDMLTIEKILYDPKGTKYKTLKYLEEKVLHDPGLATSMLIPTIYDNKKDVCNYRKDAWHHSATNEVSNASFEEMYYQAINTSISRLEKAGEYFDGKTEVEDILELVGNKSYNTGIDKGVNKYFKADIK